MARLFPNKLPGKVPIEVARTFRKLKKLPDDFSVWYSLSSDLSAPHFLLLWRERFAFLLHIASTTQQLAETALQPEMFNSQESLTPEELGSDGLDVLAQFDSRLRDQLDQAIPLRRLVVFPNVDQHTLDAITMQRTTDSEVNFLSMHQLSERDLLLLLESFASAPLDEKQVIHLRHQFAPETIVPEHFSPLSPRDRNTAASIYTGLLDLDQEWCVKNNLFLNEEAAEYVSSKPSNNQLITGVAGSGKSLVLLYRAMLNAKLNPSSTVLVLTHNKAINYELEGKFANLDGSPESVQWRTFFDWAMKMLPDVKERIIGDYVTEEILATKLNLETPFSSGFLKDEIGSIKDNGTSLLENYLSMDRSGRGKRLTEYQRRQVWDVYLRYENHLRQNHCIDWHDVALRFHAAVTNGTIRFPSYDCILIDEAQFFAKVWFDIVMAALKPTGELFLAADPTQGFLKRGQSWISSGIDVRGRSRKLNRAYRNTRAILRFARAVASSRKLELNDETETNLPDEQMLADSPIEGNPPEFICCPSVLDSHRRVVAEICALKENNHPNGQILVILANSSHRNALYQMLVDSLGSSDLVHDCKNGPRPHQAFCQVCTLNAATGLESPIVFLLGIDSLLEQEDSPHLSDDERRELKETNTRKIYMAITRAAQRLVITTEQSSMAASLKKLTTND